MRGWRYSVRRAGREYFQPALCFYMIKLTESAAKQVRKSAREGGMDGLPLRIAVERKDDNFHYLMGFDDKTWEGDLLVRTQDIDVVISNGSRDLVRDMTIDYVELEEGKFHFIFLNPNDPAYVNPRDVPEA